MKRLFRIGPAILAGVSLPLSPGCSDPEPADPDPPEAKVTAPPAESPEPPSPELPKEVETPQESELTDRAKWSDEAGNFIKFRDNPDLVNPDIIAVHALSNEGNLVVVYQFDAGNLDRCFAQKTGSPPAPFGAAFSEIHVDIDNDPSTGAKLGPKDNEQGYELRLTVMTGFGFLNSQSGEANAMFGDVGFPDHLTNLKPDASHMTWILDGSLEERGTWSKLSHDQRTAEARRLTVLSEDQVTVYIPYEWFGMKSGDVVRVAYTDEKSDHDELSVAHRIRLK